MVNLKQCCGRRLLRLIIQESGFVKIKTKNKNRRTVVVYQKTCSALNESCRLTTYIYNIMDNTRRNKSSSRRSTDGGAVKIPGQVAVLSFSKREFYFNDDSRGHVRRRREQAVDLRHYFQMSAAVAYYIPLHIDEHTILYVYTHIHTRT